jgi:hypothetical protein
MVCGVGFCLPNNVDNIDFVSFFENILGKCFEKCVIQISKTLLNISLAYP